MRDTTEMFIRSNTPGAIYKDLLILGTLVPDGALAAPLLPVTSGPLTTGDLRWTFHTIPHPGEYGYDTWPKEAYIPIQGEQTPGQA